MDQLTRAISNIGQTVDGMIRHWAEQASLYLTGFPYPCEFDTDHVMVSLQGRKAGRGRPSRWPRIRWMRLWSDHLTEVRSRFTGFRLCDFVRGAPPPPFLGRSCDFSHTATKQAFADQISEEASKRSGLRIKRASGNKYLHSWDKRFKVVF